MIRSYVSDYSVFDQNGLLVNKFSGGNVKDCAIGDNGVRRILPYST